MAVGIGILPLEIIYNILLPMMPCDILNYCMSSKKSQLICDDDRFWMNKLDYDFMSRDRNGNILIPSRYIGGDWSYSMHLGGLDTYRRWRDYFLHPRRHIWELIDTYAIDYIMFDSDIYGFDTYTIEELFRFALLYKDIYLLEQLRERGLECIS